ncbi:MAG: GtrA family protein [Promethearchaeota archaeon]
MEHDKQNEQALSDSFISRIIKLVFSKSFIYQGIRFGIVGGIGTFVNLSILYVLTDIYGILYLISETVAFIVAVIHNYIWNKIYTFDEEIKEKVVGKGIKFTIICIIALCVNLLVLFILVEYFKIFYLLAEIGAICVAFFVNFFGNRFWTFRHKIKAENPRKQVNIYIVEFIISCLLFLLGITDIFFGFTKEDWIYILLGVPLIAVFIISTLRLIIIKVRR